VTEINDFNKRAYGISGLKKPPKPPSGVKYEMKPDTAEFKTKGGSMDASVKQIVDKFSKFGPIDAIVLSGSRTGIVPNKESDYDIYIYSSQKVPVDFREKIANEFSTEYEVGNDFFGDGDELILPNGVGVDLMYRDIDWAKSEVKRVWQDKNASVGFSTAFIHNLKTSKILYDKNGQFAEIKRELSTTYPDGLKTNIVAKNYPVLRSKMTASFYEQIEKAVERNDLFSQNHRTTALLNSYFDIIFAINGQTHPGEKRLVDWAEKTCPILPLNFRENVEEVVKNASSKDVLKSLDKMLDELDVVLKKKNYI